MTPLGELLDMALSNAELAGVSAFAIARQAKISHQSLYRARGRRVCSEATLAAVLEAIASLTGERFDLELVRVPSGL